MGLNLALLLVMLVTSARSNVSISLVPRQAGGPFSPGAVMVCAQTGAAGTVSAVIANAAARRKSGGVCAFSFFFPRLSALFSFPLLAGFPCSVKPRACPEFRTPRVVVGAHPFRRNLPSTARQNRCIDVVRGPRSDAGVPGFEPQEGEAEVQGLFIACFAIRRMCAGKRCNALSEPPQINHFNGVGALVSVAINSVFR